MPQSVRTMSATRAVVFAPLAGAGRAELVTQRLTDAIILGVLHNGERLPSESGLAKQFGVATVTAREALESLREKGLVQTKRGRDGGSFVTFTGSGHEKLLEERLAGISRVELRDSGVHYAAIAGASAELATDRATSTDVENLRTLIGRTDFSSESATRRGHGAFRLEVAALSQSARLVREELQLQAEFGPLLWLCLRSQDYRDRCHSAQEDVAIAIETMDGESARQVTVGQITDAVEWLIEVKAEHDMEGADGEQGNQNSPH
jgi:DNA-binding FadR family transcriptional regulator